MTNRAKLNMTEKLIRNMTTEEQRRVAVMRNADTFFSVSKIPEPTPYIDSCMVKFKVEWSCHAVVQLNDGSLWDAKQRMANHIKNDMYRDVVNELYRIAEEIGRLPVETKALDSIFGLIEELS